MPPLEPSARLLPRLAEARRRLGPDALLAFDADGTLWEGDIGFDTFAALTGARAIRDDALDALSDEARRHGLPAGPDPNALARSLYEAYLAGAYPEDRVCSMMAWAFAGFRRDECEAFAREVVASAGLARRMQAEVEPVLAWARAEGVAVWIVSASPRASVEAAARALGFDPARVIAVTPAEAPDGTLLPRTLEPMPYDQGKADLLRRATGDAPVLAAFGNGAFDAPMLWLAAHPVAVRPSPALIERLAATEGAITLAPEAR
ncbi:MAG TPA: haloacid dehalogenase-like hydrolase [Polyangiaceae bacterium]|nr:haloacid dehalogenase-like hydrolase [Polyangiaceae bacterium]